MIAYPDALALLLDAIRPLESESLPLADAARRFLAADLHSPMALPSFDNAAMDGYAVRAHGKPLPAGVSFAVAAMQAAGDTADAFPQADACEIATGARMPEGFDTVVPVERSERRDGQVRFPAEERAGQNVRRAGSDIARGELALARGRRIDTAATMLLAALGVAHVDVVRRPRVAVIATGSELNATGPLPPGGIHDSNGPFLEACFAHWGTDMLTRTRVPDVGDAFAHAVGEAIAARADLIVTTGAVSAGRFDFVPAALASLGARELFHKVAIRPGKPLLATRFDGGPIVLALPGNPMAVAVGYRFFVAPVLRAMAGLFPERPTRVRMAAPLIGRDGLHHFALGRLEHGADGRQTAHAADAQASFRILPFATSNTWLSASDAHAEHADAWPLDPVDAA
ncbi:molybdopterin molybdotransferase MoeA [Luteibacter flocculans]|uniref:Molybdopterin molybdenumtransferase n=1 Tax=Luteibacter flocculans TaxID=2780091 RepID=A0ABY4T526_9GAMM|nr:molybdopterin molybdotransferase MoeA [Luteibacter flocculans]URL57999.1 molybdopterin molybdotransferase MoeA [Luteibacter flocculans]